MIHLLFALALAAPAITSVTPNNGPVAGGTRVVIKGTGFSDICIACLNPSVPPGVSFGAIPSPEVKFIDATTLEAVAPPSLPWTTSVTVYNNDGSGSATKQNAFTYTGDARDAFEPILFPVFRRPVLGLFGSDFRTFGRVFPIGPVSPVRLYGQNVVCYLFTPTFDEYTPVTITTEGTLLPDCNDRTGRILWTQKGAGDSLAFGLRVADVSRSATSHGTEIPVVRESDFTTGRIALLGVPTDPRFRLTLRIYSLVPPGGPVSIDGYGQVALTPGRDLFDPSYAEIPDLPRTLTRVVLQPGPTPIWAFITVTNNETQQITTITPQ